MAKKFFLSFLALVLIGEFSMRTAIDIKLYESDDELGYWIKPDQTGGALLTGSYHINDAGFGTERPLDLSGSQDVILVGDSIVFGTRKLDHDELLGPAVEEASGWLVWPLATGSWALTNSLRALSRKELAGAEAIVFVVSSTDLADTSQWQSDYHTPREEPISYLLYTTQKLFPPLRFRQDPLPVREGSLEKEWAEFRQSVDVPVFVIGHEWIGSKGTKCNWMPVFIDAPTSCFDPFALDPNQLMLDGIHLSGKGNKELGSFIAKNVDF